MLKNRKFNRSLLFIPLVLIILLHMPMVFAGKYSNIEYQLIPSMMNSRIDIKKTDSSNLIVNSLIEQAYDNLKLDEQQLSVKAFAYAIKGFNYLVKNGLIANEHIISIVDFSQPSSKKRMFVIDLDSYQVLYNTYVSHGVNSGKLFARQFSNNPASYQSSLGFYETQNTYMGGNGYSLKLEGLEKGLNDNAGRRAIVIHGAAYANESFVKTQGYLGRSWGCPALPEKLHKPIIDKIKNGTCLFIYSPDNAYLQKSRIINA